MLTLIAMTHGTDGGYARGCRESCCREAHALSQRLRRGRYWGDRRRDLQYGLSDVAHGKRATYNNHRCRCSECVHANRMYQRKFRMAA